MYVLNASQSKFTLKSIIPTKSQLVQLSRLQVIEGGKRNEYKFVIEDKTSSFAFKIILR